MRPSRSGSSAASIMATSQRDPSKQVALSSKSSAASAAASGGSRVRKRRASAKHSRNAASTDTSPPASRSSIGSPTARSPPSHKRSPVRGFSSLLRPVACVASSPQSKRSVQPAAATGAWQTRWSVGESGSTFLRPLLVSGDHPGG